MIVADASALLDALLKPIGFEALWDRLVISRETLHVPHLIDLEIAQVLRRRLAARVLSHTRAEQVLEDWRCMRVRRHAHIELLDSIWALRDRLTAYDAAYVALAQTLDVPLITRDRGLAAVVENTISVELY